MIGAPSPCHHHHIKGLEAYLSPSEMAADHGSRRPGWVWRGTRWSGRKLSFSNRKLPPGHDPGAGYGVALLPRLRRGSMAHGQLCWLSGDFPSHRSASAAILSRRVCDDVEARMEQATARDRSSTPSAFMTVPGACR
jgi:hypothetical protein